MSAAEERRVYEQADRLYGAALLDPAVDLEQLLWLADLTLSCYRDYLYALEAEVLQTFPPWQRRLVRLLGARRLLGALEHCARARRLLAAGAERGSS